MKAGASNVPITLARSWRDDCGHGRGRSNRRGKQAITMMCERELLTQLAAAYHSQTSQRYSLKPQLFILDVDPPR